MLKSKSFLCIDFGATTLKVAEFEPNETGSLRLKNYALRDMGQAAFGEGEREAVLLQTLKDVLAEGVRGGFKANVINVCAPGFQVFSKFVKLPPTDPGKVNQIIQYEAQQNVPFPLDEVVWDYQIMGTAPSGELEVLLVAIKNEVVESLFHVGEQAGLEMRIADVSSATLCNAYRFNYGDSEECVMLLDIGARSSNLLFFEGGRVYARSITIGANSITQDFATEANMTWEDAEKMKIEEGFVSLGGAYEEPSNPQQALISKIARQVMTRLHIQMNQTIQFYRGQQGGAAPTKLYLAGGASLLPYTAQFFQEKLTITVEYFNPFRNIQIDPEISLEDMAKVAHQFGEVVGLGIRNLAQCPVELNLLPASHQKQQQFNAKRLYFVGAVGGLLVTTVAFGWFYGWLAGRKQIALQDLKAKMEPIKAKKKELDVALAEMTAATNRTQLYQEVLASRGQWSELLSSIQSVLTAAQTNHGVKGEASAAPADGGAAPGAAPSVTSAGDEVMAAVWIEKLEAAAGAAVRQPSPFGGIPPEDGGLPRLASGMAAAPQGFPGAPLGPASGLGAGFPGAPLGPASGMGAGISGAQPGQPVVPAGPREIAFLNLNCRALNLLRYAPEGNSVFVNNLASNFVAVTNLFLPEGTILTNKIEQVDPTNHTFTFSLTLQLKNPIRF
ncbi:MAG: type IV pilus assembly protein PilM [Verrucomicrobia bacterium]|nr:type IV pilus assembly protein PilM [Verrucomicrobiota bacterium]